MFTVVFIALTQLYASQKTDEATDDGLESRVEHTEDLGIINFLSP
jgi:hypothetical protein